MSQAALWLGSALLPAVVRDAGTWNWVYSLWLFDIWIPQSPQELRRVSMLKLLRGSVKTNQIDRVVIYICVWNDGYITGIGVHVNRC